MSGNFQQQFDNILKNDFKTFCCNRFLAVGLIGKIIPAIVEHRYNLFFKPSLFHIKRSYDNNI